VSDTIWLERDEAIKLFWQYALMNLLGCQLLQAGSCHGASVSVLAPLYPESAFAMAQLLTLQLGYILCIFLVASLRAENAYPMPPAWRISCMNRMRWYSWGGE